MYHLTARSKNLKTGPIPVSMSDASTCPDACPLQAKGCYAKAGPLLWQWRKFTARDRGLSFRQFLAKIRALPAGQLWRHNQAGDLPGEGDILDVRKLASLVKANMSKRGFTFTHKPLFRKAERDAIKKANRDGFTVNLSADNLAEADDLAALGIAPVVSIVPSFYSLPDRTEGGYKIVKCPGQYNGMTCEQCQLCAVPHRKSIVAFAAHGTAKKHVAAIAQGGTQDA